MAVNAWRNDKFQLAQCYDDIAGTYLRLTEPLTHYLPAVRAFLADSVHAGSRVLDLGCGPGHVTGDLPADVEVVGVDLSSRMLQEARKRRPAGRYLLHDFHQPLPADVGCFDVVLACGAFDFCEDLTEVIGHAARALVPGGRLLFMLAERRMECLHHGGRWLEMQVGAAAIRVYLWTFAEAVAALEASALRPLTYRYGPGWEVPSWGAVIQYGYWVVERPPTAGQTTAPRGPAGGGSAG